MPRMTKPLTDTEIKKAKPREKEFSLGDGKGLFLRVSPAGSKLWLFNYTRPINKRRANLSLGTYPDVSLQAAREKAQQFRAVLAAGVDPQDRLEEEHLSAKTAEENTFQAVAEKWLHLKKAKVSASYYEKMELRLKKHIFPVMGRLPIHKISAQSAIATLSPLAESAKLETVRKLCRWINEVMDFAVNTGISDHNPCSGIRKAFNAPVVRHNPTLKPEQLPLLMRKIRSSGTTQVIRLLLEWQLHTMVRPAEAAGATWDEINLEDATWVIPAARMKKGKAHTVPLTKETQLILEQLHPISGNRKHIFPGEQNPKKSASSQSANNALKRMGLAGQQTSHGLRALASTALNEKGFDADVIEAALAHKDTNAIRAVYNRAEYLDKRREMMAWWSSQISNALTDDSVSKQSRKKKPAGQVSVEKKKTRHPKVS